MITTGYEQINEIIIKYGVIKIEKWIKHSSSNNTYDGVRLDRIYRGFIEYKSMSKVDNIINDLKEAHPVLDAYKEVYPRLLYNTNDQKSNSQCELDAVGASEAWDYWDIPDTMPGSSEVLLASVDTGVDYTHPDLEENIWINSAEIPSTIYDLGFNPDNSSEVWASEIISFLAYNNFDWNSDGKYNLKDVVASGSLFEDGVDGDGNGYIDDIIGWDSGEDDNDPFPDSNNDFWSHGTHVAGILSAVTDNGIGTSSISFNSRIISVKITDYNI